MLIQLHRNTFQDLVEELLPIIYAILASQSHMDDQSYARLPSFNGKKKLFVRYISAKVKLLSFLAFLSRSNPKHMKNVPDNFPNLVLQLFQQCPVEATAVRKVGRLYQINFLGTHNSHSSHPLLRVTDSISDSPRKTTRIRCHPRPTTKLLPCLT